MRIRFGPVLPASLCLVLAGAVPASAAAKKALTLEAITADPPLVSRGASDATWRDATHLTFTLPDEAKRDDPSPLFEVDAVTGKRITLIEPLAIQPRTSPEKTLSFSGAIFSPDGRTLLLSGDKDLWLYDLGKKDLRRLTHDEAEEEVPSFSPDGRLVAFVRKNDLYTLDVASLRERRLTTTGTETVLNGVLDWVYEEELANRKSRKAYAFSPDSASIVYLSLDDTHVPEYPIVDYIPTHGKVRLQRYPKAGDPNPVPSVHVVDVATGRAAASAAFGGEDLYVGWQFTWLPDSSAACYVTLDRAQRRLEASLLPRDGGKGRRILADSDEAWINSIDPPHFFADGSGFLFLSERTGFLHLYRYRIDGTLDRALTSGGWMIDDGLEIDEAHRLAYFTATEKDPRERHLYRVSFDGGGVTRVSEGRGYHTLKLSPGGDLLYETASNVDEAPRSWIRRAAAAPGGPVVPVATARNQLGDYTLGTTEFSSFTGPDGTTYYTSLVKPADFDPKRKYPVVVYVYGGPHSQVVEDRWGSTTLMEHLLAGEGFLVFSVDNHGSWGRGHAFEKPLLKRFGDVELKDQLLGVSELSRLPFVDPKRIAIWGWSYGGFMALTAATKAGATFKCAIAGAPVADWRLYDSIYTERYLKLPKENEAGYEASSPVTAAASLGTKLLVLHGTSDDNVHLQNSLLFLDGLMRAKKDYEFVPLLAQKHGPRDNAARTYIDLRILEFLKKNL